MSLGLFGATDDYFCDADQSAGVGQIRIERERMLAFLRHALGRDIDVTQHRVRTRMVSDQRQRFGQFRPGRRHSDGHVFDEEMRALDHVCARRSGERVDIVGVSGERATRLVRLGVREEALKTAQSKSDIITGLLGSPSPFRAPSSMISLVISS
jgi:hypothetical protein